MNKDHSKNWLQSFSGGWRDIDCPCGSSFHFDGRIEELFTWERIHIKHMATDYDNHSMISFYPKDMVIFYHSKSGYVVERRRHKSHEIQDIFSRLNNDVKLIGV